MDARDEHVRHGGHREILAVAVADTESEATYHQVVRDLKARGLRGVRLATSDDPLGLKAAIDRHCQGASWQRCQAHVARNLVTLVGAGRRAALAAYLREIVAATTRTPAMTIVVGVVARWDFSCPVVARLFEEGSEACLACLSFPVAHRARLRTTNGLARLREESKRRTRVVRMFPNPAACRRLVTARGVEQSEAWVSGRRSLTVADPPLVERGRVARAQARGIRHESQRAGVVGSSASTRWYHSKRHRTVGNVSYATPRAAQEAIAKAADSVHSLCYQERVRDDMLAGGGEVSDA